MAAPSDQYVSRAAVAVTNAGLLPRKVPLCSPGSQMSSSGLNRHSDMGSPYPLMDLDTVTMSGVMPASSKEKKAPVRPQPIWMSSTISSMSCRVHSSARAAQPLGPGDVDAALALHGLDDHGGGLVEPGALVLEAAARTTGSRGRCPSR